jgi:quercetin dioxygenase-like cupin family protein
MQMVVNQGVNLMLTRRDVFAVLISAPCALEAFVASAEDTKDEHVMGPSVFRWEDMHPVKTETGEVRSLCKAPTATVDQLEIHVTTLNPGQMPHPPHRHVNEELIILREGRCETLSDGKWVRVGPGSVVFNASNSLHGFRNVGDAPAVYHVINWSPNRSKSST